MTDFLWNNIDVISIIASPVVVYVIFKLKKYKGKRNDLTGMMVKLHKQHEALNKRSKTIF